jgi:chaperone required for assembly of F1-ATPase
MEKKSRKRFLHNSRRKKTLKGKFVLNLDGSSSEETSRGFVVAGRFLKD